ncbi:CHAT domain-containing protein [Sphaerotilus sp.]|uniref:CHAT domain-containing protein n=1 Tax=Sphaerotilus sp. TaxID=2093942 RepID=UPI002ACEB68C|nr:CHAT domain-containing protein [Sphaerotilus sp.]MDZ7857275.1 CHAT domain-containing protein [Sphaerotilus sp.]
MKATIELRGSDVFCRAEDTQASGPSLEQRLDLESALPRLQDWARRYDEAVRADSGADTLRLIGRELWDWLDKPAGWAAAWAAGTGARVLDICVRPDALQDEAARALLDAPWELLSGPQGWLAEDAVQPFEVVRRIGAAATPRVAEFVDLQMLFMAAAPEGQHVLSFEAEEAAILQATQRKPLHLFVEETGSAEWLKDRLVADGPFDVLHLSCHGDIDKRRGPVLALEDDRGGMVLTEVPTLVEAIGEADRLPLLFLSACRTAERVESGEEGRRRAAEPMVRELIRAGVAHVLGWDGSVRDVDAAAFAEHFYDELAQGRAVALAAARARSKLLRTARTDPNRGAHWHLARLYVGAHGGGPLIARQGQGKKRQHAGQGVDRQFLDKQRQRVPVAGRGAFVGRRRVLQRVFRAFAEVDSGSGGGCGVLLHGMGNLGKSSVAARVASRLHRHQTVVVFERYDALAVLDGLKDAVPVARRQSFMDEWREAVRQDGGRLADALEALLDLLGSHHDGQQAAAPLLLIIDDLERILETPKPGDEAGVRVRAGDGRVALQAILTAFDRMAGRTASRLLLTSRYRFTLPDDWGSDLAERLIPVPLQPMSDIDQLKQWDAALRLLTKAPADTPELRRLMLRAIGLAVGNPGLQEVLTRPLLSGELAVAERAMATIEQFQANGEIPADLRARVALPAVQLTAADQGNALLQFFRRMAFETYRAALTPDQLRQLQAATLFDSGLPVPRAALEAVGQAAGVTDAAAATDRLLGLGLFDDFGKFADVRHAAVNPLARPLAESLANDELPMLASAVLPALAQAWVRDGAFLRSAPFAAESWRLLRLAPVLGPAVLIDGTTAVLAAHRYAQDDHAQRILDELVQPACAALDRLEHPPSLACALAVHEVAVRAAHATLRDASVEWMLAMANSPFEQANVLWKKGQTLVTQGQLHEAAGCFSQAATLLRQSGNDREVVVVLGTQADILQSRGQLDEALRIRLEEQLPVYERLGDVREKAVTQGKIADILQSRGQLDEALRIRLEEELPVYERLGDVRSKAVTQGKIADILQSRGQLDEALRIRLEEELPVYERLGDVRSKAVTQGKIADILQSRGQLDEALALHVERLTVFEQLGDIDGVAHTRFASAQLRIGRGDHEVGGIQAIYEDLAHSFAINQKLQRPDGIAVVGMLLAQVLAMGGLRDGALKVLDAAEQGFRTLGNTEGVQQVAMLRQQVGGAGGVTG